MTHKFVDTCRAFARSFENHFSDCSAKSADLLIDYKIVAAVVGADAFSSEEFKQEPRCVPPGWRLEPGITNYRIHVPEIGDFISDRTPKFEYVKYLNEWAEYLNNLRDRFDAELSRIEELEDVPHRRDPNAKPVDKSVPSW